MFRLNMLPASEGDCMILSYGQNEQALRHVVIDGGRKATWPHLRKALEAIAAKGQTVELLLLTHIDADHIDGLVEMLEEEALPLSPAAIWYNGYDQLKAMVKPGGVQPFGFKAADAYSKALARRKWPINAAFDGQAIFIDSAPRAFEFAGLSLTLISPSRAKLDKLRANWQKALAPKPAVAAPGAGGNLQAFGKRAMPAVLDVEKLSAPSPTDSAPPNGSSIALIAEYDGRRVLLGADAHPDVLIESLTALAGEGRYAVDLFKLPHHGSRANLTREIVEKVECARYAISTSGAVFGHPDPEAIARILKFGAADNKILYFNYASERTKPWNAADLTDRYGHECRYPEDEGRPLSIEI